MKRKPSRCVALLKSGHLCGLVPDTTSTVSLIWLAAHQNPRPKPSPLPTPTLSQAVCNGFSWTLRPAGRCGLPNIQNSQGLPDSLRRPRESKEGRCRARSASVVERSQQGKASPLYGCRQCKFSLRFFRLYPAAHPALHFSPPQHGRYPAL